MSRAMPTIPPRPARSHASEGPTTSSAASKVVPHIPPRPIRRMDRSTSPQRFARSPLNEAPLDMQGNNRRSSFLYSTESAGNPTSDLARITSSVALPSVGQEGHEYADVFAAEEADSSPTETRNIGEDVKLHAPKPSLPAANAKQRVSAVTRTDSSQAAAFGVGKPDSNIPSSKSLKTKASFVSQGSNGTSDFVPASYESESGIPEIGQRVPMYPDAGDVQAPSPGPGSAPFTPGIGFYNDGSKTPSLHGRKHSGVGFDVPPDAYGKHGHGVPPHDRFEKAYYEKHPNLFKKEIDPYHERAEWAMSSDDLNKIVRDTASRGAGMGTSPHIMSTPSEQIGFIASEEYASRMSSPRSISAAFSARPSLDSQDVLRAKKQAGSETSPVKKHFESALSKSLRASYNEGGNKNDDVIHVDAPEHPRHKVYGGDIPPRPTDSLGLFQALPEESDQIRAQDVYTAPILAEDELAKTPIGCDLKPAVSPRNDHRIGSYDEGSFSNHRSGSGISLPGGTSASRSNSTPQERWGSADPRPLDLVEEYEPLFPEGSKDGKDTKLTNNADKMKRPDHKNRRFPSQDVWEDTPSSLQYTTIVSTPQLPEEIPAHPVPDPNITARAFAREQEELAEAISKTPDSFLGPAKKAWSSDVESKHENRPMSRRFPSRDVWEDTPDSLQLQTTVGSPQEEGTHPAQSANTSSIDTTSKSSQPQIPERPNRNRLTPRGASSSPPPTSKPKPHIPSRPTRTKPVTRESSENVPLSQVPSISSEKSTGSDQVTFAPPIAKPKPKPSGFPRPVVNKIAALQGGFMADLNKRLQTGPEASGKADDTAVRTAPEKQTEKVILADARKGRARGPARKAPAKITGPTASPLTALHEDKFTLSGIKIWFEVDPLGDESVVVSGGSGDIAPRAVTGKTVTGEERTFTVEQASETQPMIGNNSARTVTHVPNESKPKAEPVVDNKENIADVERNKESFTAPESPKNNVCLADLSETVKVENEE